MKIVTAAFIVFFLVGCAYTSELISKPDDLEVRVMMEREFSLPRAWNKVKPANKDQTVTLTFALKQENLPLLRKMFWQVSDPLDPLYGKHLTMEQVNDLVRPSQANVKMVKDWIRSYTDNFVHKNDFIVAKVNVSTAEQMVNCSYHVFTHKKNPKFQLTRCASTYYLPSGVADALDFVGGVVRFPQVRESKQSPKRSSQQDFQVTPRLLKDRYFIGDAVGKSPNNTQAVAQFLEQYYSNADLQEFFAGFLQSAVGNSPTVVGPNYFGAGVEASLDIEYIMSTGQNIPTTFWSTGGLHEGQEPFLQWLIDISNTKNPPYLFSVSYGDDEDSLSLDYVNRVDVEFQKQGLRGISFLFASGDDGVGGSDFGGCTKFVPNYPASSIYVTAVGGTTLEGWFETGKEIVNGLSGGGFSNYESRPGYQQQAVQSYLTSQAANLPSQQYWNRTGRAYPDIAALSANFIVVVNFIPFPGVAGTSCAAPTISGIFGLLNDLRLQSNKPPLGFLNPLLYRLAATQPQVFTDITEGSNPGCGTNGFPATTGWDPASGLGSINYAEFAKIINSF